MNNFKKFYERAQQTINSFDEPCRKRLQDNAVDEKNEPLPNIFTKYVNEIKNNSLKEIKLGG